jgi:hypothetical protein
MYKKIFMMLLALSSAARLKAQTQKGDQLLGISGGFGWGQSMVDYISSANNYGYYESEGKNRSYTVGPNYSIFVVDNLDLGGNIGYSHQKSTLTHIQTGNSYSEKANAHELAAVVYLRKYFLYDNKVGIRTGPFASYGITKSAVNYVLLSGSSATSIVAPISGAIISGGLGLDFVYFPCKELGLAASPGSLRYTSIYRKDDIMHTKGSYNKFGFNFVSGVNLSVFFAFK